ncbi:uncharacterized protein LOC133779394 [Humulus lupulus]|uniref:uncharacterized protein LOC133779394 n=1 Tax=Humulus lupulus TaxID=3486 RepID=UPI002B4058B3|nr:uncharacterized protein LOC133779394 [Humulus lupulus]
MLGLDYEKIDACPKDCMLYRKEHANDTECEVCSTPRSEAKVLRHFPLIPRLQRLFMSSKTSDFMTWHHKKEHTSDGCMRHPRDSPAWITFDHNHKDFAADPRNVRLGLASDGMNPFKTLSVSHNAPGNNIDVYLKPLIEELKDLWEIGVKTFDASTKKNFNMRASLLWTISDFPAYANLSGWSTKGKYACPSCHEDTCYLWLKYSKKHCYMGHRRWLVINDPFRNDEKSFDGTEEKRMAPTPLSGSMILDTLAGYQIKFGKTAVNPPFPYGWKKENAKNKDNLNARLDLKYMGIRSELHPKESESKKTVIPPACFTLSKNEKIVFCRFLKTIKVPDGYAANISRCVDVRYLSKLKSYVRNKSKPEGCIAEGYLADECLTFCSRYMEGVETKFNRKPRNYSNIESNGETLPTFQTTGRHLGKIDTETLDEDTKVKAHRYVLFNCNIVDSFIEEHRNMIAQQNSRQTTMTIDQIHSQSFPSWFANKVEELYDNGDNRVSEDLRCLEKGPNNVSFRFKRYLINGFRFHTKEIEKNLRTQNSGVIMIAKTQSFASSRDPNLVFEEVTFYGMLTDIIELDYSSENHVLLFKCDWVSRSGVKKENDCTRVNFSRLLRDNEPFILASQAEQVMYIEDLKHEGWHVALKINPRDYYNMSMQSHDENVESYVQTEVCSTTIDIADGNVSLVREDMQDITIDTSLSFDTNDMDEEA